MPTEVSANSNEVAPKELNIQNLLRWRFSRH